MEQSDTKEQSPEVFAPGYLIAGRYEIEKLLGSGGMGAVYLAKDRILASDHVAIKVLHRQLAFEQKYTQRFLREVQLMRRVNHPNVVRTFDVGADGDTVYLTMEYAPGRSLLRLIERDNLAVEQLPELIIQICEGLEAIHSAGIIHRDLKPENIIVVEDGTAKITDFGVARPEFSELTAHNEIIGSAAYMAPEVWSGKSLTTSLDLYGLGIILYEMATGSLPFEAESPAALMRKHLDEEPVAPREVNKAVPQWLNRVILRLMAKAPEDRPRSAREVIEMVQAGAARAVRRRQPIETAAPDSSAESNSLFSQLEERTKRATDPNATLATTRGETKDFRGGPGRSRSFLNLPKVTARESKAPLRLSQLRLRGFTDELRERFQGVGFFAAYAAALGLALYGLHRAVYWGEPLPPNPSIPQTLEYGLLPALLTVFTLATPLALLSTFSGTLTVITRSTAIAVVFQLVAALSMLGYHLLPVLMHGDFDGASLRTGSLAAKEVLVDLALLSPYATVFQHSLLSQGIAFHSPELTPVWSSLCYGPLGLVYVLAVIYVARKTAAHTTARPGIVYALLPLGFAALYGVAYLSPTAREFLLRLAPLPANDITQMLLGFEPRMVHLFSWLYLYVSVGILAPLFGGPAHDR